MKIQDEILINKFGQGLILLDSINLMFEEFIIEQKKVFLNEIINLISQSKPIKEDIELAIIESKLKQTFTPCVILKKGIESHNLKIILSLPEQEFNKSFVLLLNLFKIAYNRRFKIEKNNPYKWWYWDLKDENVLKKIVEEFGINNKI